MCGQSVALWKLEVAVLTADKVLNANARQRSLRILSSMESRDEAQEASGTSQGKNFRWCLFMHIFHQLFGTLIPFLFQTSMIVC